MAKKISEQQKEIPGAIARDAFDALAWEGINTAEKLQPLQENPGAASVAQDIFTACYKMNPQVNDAAPTLQKSIAKTLLDMPEFQNLHQSTQLDELSSALGTVQLGPEMIEQFQKAEQSAQKRREERQKNPGKPGQPGGQPGGEQTPESLEDLIGEQAAGAMRSALRSTLEQAQNDVDEWQDTCSAWGIGKGDLQSLPTEEKMETAKMLQDSRSLKRIAELAGRFKNIVNGCDATTFSHGNDEIIDITTGSDLSRLLPTEMMKLKTMPLVFYRDFLEKKLLQYNLKGQEPQGKGPIIVCVDSSDSMSGEKDHWAKALVIALLHLAVKQSRAFGFISFDDGVTLQKFFPAQNPPSIQEKLEIAAHFTGGGTEFAPPLTAALDMRDKEPSLNPADIIFITDGECRLSPELTQEINTRRKSAAVRTYGVAVCTTGTTLEPFCDTIARLSNTGEIDIVSDLISHAAATVTRKEKE